jgi:hypothetical protein
VAGWQGGKVARWKGGRVAEVKWRGGRSKVAAKSMPIFANHSDVSISLFEVVQILCFRNIVTDLVIKHPVKVILFILS